jgi:hypothetical protein
MRIMVLVAVSIFCLALAGFPAAPADQMLAQYYVIQKSLASDSVNGVAASAAEIAKTSRQAAASSPNKAQLTALAEAASKLSGTDLKSVRSGFGDLSDKMIAYFKASGAKTDPPYQFYCSMAKKNWLQPDKPTRNPYYGSEMPTCGVIVQFGKMPE